MCAGLPLLSSKHSPNVIVNNSIRIWAQFRRHFGLQGASTLSPVQSNHMFTPSCIDAAFAAWSSKGIRTIQNLFIEDVFASFLQLAQTYALPKTHFFRYLQIRSFVQKSFGSFPDKPTDTHYDCILELNSDCKGLISQVYNCVIHRAHLSNARLARIYPSIEPLCPRCRGQPADLIHMFWLCPNLSSFWVNIFNAFSEMFGTRFDPNPVCALFGLTPEQPP